MARKYTEQTLIFGKHIKLHVNCGQFFTRKKSGIKCLYHCSVVYKLVNMIQSSSEITDLCKINRCGINKSDIEHMTSYEKDHLDL